MSTRTRLRSIVLAAASAIAVTALSIVSPAGAQSPAHSGPAAPAIGRNAGAGTSNWTAAWRAAVQQPFPSGVSSDGFTNQTVRMVIHCDVSGNTVRIRLSNAYGTHPLVVGAASLAEHTTGPDITTGSRRAVSFDRRANVSIPVGDEVVSDPVPLRVRRGESLDVSLYLPAATGPTSWHYEAEATTYISVPGDWTTQPGGSPFQTITPSWFFLDGVDVRGPTVKGTVVAFGDSITDGHYSTIDANGRWPDWLARRTPRFSVINEGIGGNQILKDVPTAGVSALHRLDRDMLDQLGVTDVIFLEGINDIGSSNATAAQVINAMTQIINRAHARCLNIIGGTLTPFEGAAYYSPARERVREAVNRWIRTSGRFDGVADFDKAVRNPHNPLALNPRYDTGGGHLHPNDLGYRAMADVINLHLLEGHRRSNCN